MVLVHFGSLENMSPMYSCCLGRSFTLETTGKSLMRRTWERTVGKRNGRAQPLGRGSTTGFGRRVTSSTRGGSPTALAGHDDSDKRLGKHHGSVRYGVSQKR